MPALSVLVPVRNALPWLGASLRSLWRQSHRDFEVIAVNDGSTDGSGEALDRAAASEPRLRVVHVSARGLPLALNEGLRHARATLIARHDADDVSHRDRFRLQLETLRRQPAVSVVGTRMRLFPAAATSIGMRRWVAWHNALLEHEEMRRERFIDSPLAHATAIMRREALEAVGGWAERGWAEDLDLWMRLLERGARFAKRPERLYGWRQHRASATHRDPRYRRERFVALKLECLERGLLSGRGTMTLVGVGESLERSIPVFERGRRVKVVRAGRPSPVVIRSLDPPIVLVFLSPVARLRWRKTLVNFGHREDTEFVFIA